MKVPLVDLVAQHARIRDDVMAAARAVIESQRFVLGEPVARFEATIARLAGFAHAAAVASGTDALGLALRALGVGEGDAVITTPLTFVATAEAIVRAGARPIFADVDPESLTLDADEVEALSGRARAVVPVNLFGRAADLADLGEVASMRGLRMIVDSAQAIGGDDARTSRGDAVCFSFFPSKPLGAWGDGGAVASADEHVIRRVRSLRQHGIVGPDEFGEVGTNSRLDALHAAVLDAKASHLATWTAERRAAAARYAAMLGDVTAITLPNAPPGASHVYSVYAIRAPRRDELAAHLASRGVETRAYYARPIHRQPAYARFHDGGPLVHAEAASRELLALPMFAEITEAQQAHVAGAIRAFYR